MVFAAATPGMPSFKTPAPSTGYSTQSQQWGGGMLAPPGGYPNMTPPPSPEEQALQNSLAYSSGLAGPQMAGLQQQSGMLAGQLGTTQAGYDLARQALGTDAAAQLAKVNLGPEYDTITRGAIYRQMAGLNAADQLAYQGLGNQFKGYDLQGKEAWQAAERGQWQNRSQGTAKGAVGSVGYKHRMDDIQHQLANQLQGIEINREGSVISAKQAAADRQEAKAKLDDQNKTLDVKAKEYGIDRNQIQANLQQGLAKLGIDNIASVNQILDMMSSNDIQQRALGEQIFREGMANSNYFLTLPQNTSPIPSVGGAGGNNPVAGVAVDDYMNRGATAP